MVVGPTLSWQGLKKKQCTPKGQARYVIVWGSVHWKGVYRVGRLTLGLQVFLIGY